MDLEARPNSQFPAPAKFGHSRPRPNPTPGRLLDWFIAYVAMLTFNQTTIFELFADPINNGYNSSEVDEADKARICIP